MAIRTQTVEQAAKAFRDHYKDHLRPNSPASYSDPRECTQCMRAFEDLNFALDKDEHKAVANDLSVVGNDKIIELFGRR